jgi:hypothetical protein
VCQADKEGLLVKEMAKKNGWKTCPPCGFVVERMERCLHMTCKCKLQWCWSCLSKWKDCGSSCNRTKQ